MGKYLPLHVFLKEKRRVGIQKVILSLQEINEILGFDLPPTALKTKQWWGNENIDKTTHTQCISWQTAGYKAYPTMDLKEIQFCR